MTHRAICELSTLVQPGDMLVFSDGAALPAAGHPANPAAYRGGGCWIVSVKTEFGFMPIDLYTIARVIRAKREIWNIEDVPARTQRVLI